MRQIDVNRFQVVRSRASHNDGMHPLVVTFKLLCFVFLLAVHGHIDCDFPKYERGILRG